MLLSAQPAAGWDAEVETLCRVLSGNPAALRDAVEKLRQQRAEQQQQRQLDEHRRRLLGASPSSARSPPPAKRTPLSPLSPRAYLPQGQAAFPRARGPKRHPDAPPSLDQSPFHTPNHSSLFDTQLRGENFAAGPCDWTPAALPLNGIGEKNRSKLHTPPVSPGWPNGNAPLGVPNNANPQGGVQSTPVRSFADIAGVPKWLVDTLEEEGITAPTALQAQCLENVLRGKHVVSFSGGGGGRRRAPGRCVAVAAAALCQMNFRLRCLQVVVAATDNACVQSISRLLRDFLRRSLEAHLPTNVWEHIVLAAGESSKLSDVISRLNKGGLQGTPVTMILVATPAKLQALCLRGCLALENVRFVGVKWDEGFEPAGNSTLRFFLSQLPPGTQGLVCCDRGAEETSLDLTEVFDALDRPAGASPPSPAGEDSAFFTRAPHGHSTPDTPSQPDRFAATPRHHPHADRSHTAPSYPASFPIPWQDRGQFATDDPCARVSPNSSSFPIPLQPGQFVADLYPRARRPPNHSSTFPIPLQDGGPFATDPHPPYARDVIAVVSEGDHTAPPAKVGLRQYAVEVADSNRLSALLRVVGDLRGESVEWKRAVLEEHGAAPADAGPDRLVVVAATKRTAESLARNLQVSRVGRGCTAYLHSGLTRGVQVAALDSFLQGYTTVLVVADATLPELQTALHSVKLRVLLAFDPPCTPQAHVTRTKTLAPCLDRPVLVTFVGPAPAPHQKQPRRPSFACGRVVAVGDIPKLASLGDEDVETPGGYNAGITAADAWSSGLPRRSGSGGEEAAARGWCNRPDWVPVVPEGGRHRGGTKRAVAVEMPAFKTRPWTPEKAWGSGLPGEGDRQAYVAKLFVRRPPSPPKKANPASPTASARFRSPERTTPPSRSTSTPRRTPSTGRKKPAASLPRQSEPGSRRSLSGQSGTHARPPSVPAKYSSMQSAKYSSMQSARYSSAQSANHSSMQSAKRSGVQAASSPAEKGADTRQGTRAGREVEAGSRSGRVLQQRAAAANPASPPPGTDREVAKNSHEARKEPRATASGRHARPADPAPATSDRRAPVLAAVSDRGKRGDHTAIADELEGFCVSSSSDVRALDSPPPRKKSRPRSGSRLRWVEKSEHEPGPGVRDTRAVDPPPAPSDRDVSFGTAVSDRPAADDIDRFFGATLSDEKTLTSPTVWREGDKGGLPASKGPNFADFLAFPKAAAGSADESSAAGQSCDRSRMSEAPEIAEPHAGDSESSCGSAGGGIPEIRLSTKLLADPADEGGDPSLLDSNTSRTHQSASPPKRAASTKDPAPSLSLQPRKPTRVVRLLDHGDVSSVSGSNLRSTPPSQGGSASGLQLSQPGSSALPPPDAHNLTEDDMLSEFFAVGDTNTDGHLNFDELNRILHLTTGDSIAKDQYLRLCADLSLDPGKGLTANYLRLTLENAGGVALVYDSYLKRQWAAEQSYTSAGSVKSILKKRSRSQPDEERSFIAELFSACDVDGKGLLGCEEFNNLILGVTGENLTAAEFAALCGNVPGATAEGLTLENVEAVLNNPGGVASLYDAPPPSVKTPAASARQGAHQSKPERRPDPDDAMAVERMFSDRTELLTTQVLDALV
ncbi:hypothetical protein DIPPA_11599 [Diplonema papillatum]|nr:hypothetical protein DIPPA_11599 [Diplonema papillatum]